MPVGMKGRIYFWVCFSCSWLRFIKFGNYWSVAKYPFLTMQIKWWAQLFLLKYFWSTVIELSKRLSWVEKIIINTLREIVNNKSRMKNCFLGFGENGLLQSLIWDTAQFANEFRTSGICLVNYNSFCYSDNIVLGIFVGRMDLLGRDFHQPSLKYNGIFARSFICSLLFRLLSDNNISVYTVIYQWMRQQTWLMKQLVFHLFPAKNDRTCNIHKASTKNQGWYWSMELMASNMLETDHACDWHEKWFTSPFRLVSYGKLPQSLL
jgi:hypothetical protein